MRNINHVFLDYMILSWKQFIIYWWWWTWWKYLFL